MSRINQGIAKVVFEDSSYWIRISRQKTHSLLFYWSNKNGFRYMKIYQYFGGGKGYPKYDSRRYVGKQIGYIYKKKDNNYFEYVEI